MSLSELSWTAVGSDQKSPSALVTSCLLYLEDQQWQQSMEWCPLPRGSTLQPLTRCKVSKVSVFRTPAEFYTLYVFLQDWLWMWVCYRKCTMGSALRDSKYCKFASNSGLWVSCYAHTKFCMNVYKWNYGLSAVKPSGINHWSHLGLSFARGVHSEFCDSMGESPLFLLSISFSILTLSVSQTSSEISFGWFWF